MKQEITNNRLATMPISDGTLTKEKLISMRIDMQEQLKQTRMYITIEETRRAKILSAMNEIQEHTVCFKFNSQYYVTKKDRFGHSSPFDTIDEKMLCLGALEAAKAWGNAEYTKDIKRFNALNEEYNKHGSLIKQLKENERILTSNISSIGGLVNRMREAEKNKAEQFSTLPPTSHPAIKQENSDGFQGNIASPME